MFLLSRNITRTGRLYLWQAKHAKNRYTDMQNKYKRTRKTSTYVYFHSYPYVLPIQDTLENFHLKKKTQKHRDRCKNVRYSFSYNKTKDSWGTKCQLSCRIGKC